MSIDEVTKTVEVKGNGTFDTQLDQAYAQVAKDAGYKGSLTNPKERSGFFSSFELAPIVEKGRVSGVKITYSIKGTEEKSKPTRSVAGCGPSTPKYTL